MASLFERAALAMYGNGYSLLPIGAGTKSPGIYRGVTPEGDGPWFGLKDWQSFCIERASVHKVASWGRMSEAHGGGLGIACGYGGLVAIDIDDDSLISPLRDVLPMVVVGKRGRRGATYFFRSADPLSSKNYRSTDKRGLLDFLSGGKQTVVPPTRHADTGQPYEWITPRTLLDTPLADLPVFTREHFDGMENVLRSVGWDAPDPRQPGVPVDRSVRSHGAAAGNDTFDIAVRNARPQWLQLLKLEDLQRQGDCWRSVASFRPSGSPDTGKRGLSLAIYDTGAIVDYGTGQGYNDATLVEVCLGLPNIAAAYDWLRKEIDWTAPVPVVAPTYPDRRVGLAEAEERLRALTGEEFATDIRNGIATRNLARLNPPLIQHVHSVKVSRSEAGTGKTRAAGGSIAEHTRLGRHFVYSTPNHRLAAQVATDSAMRGVKAEVYRAFDRDDPLAPPHKMCRRPDAYAAARELGVGARSAVCERLIDDKVVRCPHANVCGMERQREARPSEWIVPAALLFTKRPEFFPEPDAFVFDESFIDNAIGDTVTLDIATLLESKVEGCNDDEHAAVTHFRMRLAAAIKANGDGPLTHAALLAHEIDAEDAYWIGKLEQRRVDARLLQPDMTPRELKDAVARHRERNKLARAAGTLWHEIATFLWEWEAKDFYGDRSRSGRITAVGGTVSVTPLRTVHPSWRDAPTLILDATAPPASLVAIVLGEIEQPGLAPIVTELPDIAAKWPDHVHVRQIVGAPITMGKLGVWKSKRKDKLPPPKRPKPRNTDDIVRFIKLRAALAAPARIGLVSYKGVLERIADDLPANVDVLHFGALSGLNSMKDVAGLIVIGRPYPPPETIEAQAAVFAGRPIEAVGRYYPKRPGGIRLADGSAFAVKVDYHPDTIAEALRWRVTVGELLQAVGRLRPHRRAEPCWLDIVCDVPLPLTVHEGARWGDVAPGAEADMAVTGVILTNSRDAMTVFDISKHDAEKLGGCPDFSIRTLYRDSGATSPVRKFTYRKVGPGQRQNTGYYLPGVLPGGVTVLRAWLKDRRVALAALEVERARVEDRPGRTTAMLAKIGRDAEDRLEFKNEFASTLETIVKFFDDIGKQDD